MAKVYQYFYVRELGSGDAHTVTGTIEAEAEEEAREQMMSLPTQNRAGDYARVCYRPEGGSWKQLKSVARAIDLPETTPGPLGRFSQMWCNAIWAKEMGYIRTVVCPECGSPIVRANKYYLKCTNCGKRGLAGRFDFSPAFKDEVRALAPEAPECVIPGSVPLVGMHTQGGIIGVQVLWPTGETYRGGEYHNKWYRIHLGLEAEFDSCVRPEDLDAEDLEFGEKVTRHGIRE